MASFTDWLAIADLLSGMSAGRNQAQFQNETLGLSSANSAEGNALNRDKFNLSAPGERLHQARVADIGRSGPVTAGSGVDPSTGRKVVQWQGGIMKPDLYSPDTNALAGEVAHQHLLDQMAGPKKPIPQPSIGGTDIGSGLLAAGQGAATGMSILKLLKLLPFGGGHGSSSTYVDEDGFVVDSPGGAIRDPLGYDLRGFVSRGGEQRTGGTRKAGAR